jgi:Ca2+-transporting ATPase
MTSTTGSSERAWYALSLEETASELGIDVGLGLDDSEVKQRQEQYGLNQLPVEPPPSLWVVARGQLANPMNIMLIIVSVASFAIGQIGTGIFVAAS